MERNLQGYRDDLESSYSGVNPGSYITQSMCYESNTGVLDAPAVEKIESSFTISTENGPSDDLPNLPVSYSETFTTSIRSLSSQPLNDYNYLQNSARTCETLGYGNWPLAMDHAGSNSDTILTRGRDSPAIHMEDMLGPTEANSGIPVELGSSNELTYFTISNKESPK
jgi:hypothetical protein